MLTKTEIREMFGSRGINPRSWFRHSAELRVSAGALWLAGTCKKFPELTRLLGEPRDLLFEAISPYKHYELLAGLSLELLIKACVVVLPKAVPKHHRLANLADDAQLPVNDGDRKRLDRWTCITRWAGRYPTSVKIPEYEEFFQLEPVEPRRFEPLRGMRSNQLRVTDLDWPHFNRLWRSWHQVYEVRFTAWLRDHSEKLGFEDD